MAIFRVGSGWSFLFLFCISLALLGCGGPTHTPPQEQATLKPLALLYGYYIRDHRGQPPANEDEFRQFVEKQPAETLAQIGAKEPNQIWISPRDGQPYVILYGKVSGPPGPAGAPVVAYEKVGSGGKRMVVSSLGAFEEVTEERFRELVPNAAAAP